jgi:two-component system, NtrC family, response regulator HydG
MKNRILIIDDDFELCLLLNRFLSRNGYEVEEAWSGVKGLQKFKQGNFDIIICDYQLGDMEGLEVLKEIKAIDPDKIVLIITGSPDIKIAVDAMRSGAYDHITKPLVPDDILMVLDAITKNSTKDKQSGERSQNQQEDGTSYPGESKVLYEYMQHVARPAYSVIRYNDSRLNIKLL